MSRFVPQPLRKLQRWLLWGGGAMAVALAVAGCGGGGEAVAPAASVPAQAAPPADVVSQAAVQQAVDQHIALPRMGALASVKPGAASDDFESGMADWSNWGNAQVVAGAGTSGSNAMRVGTGAGGAGLTVPGIVAGTTYRLTARVRAGNPDEQVDVGINMLDSSGNKITGGGSITRGPATPDGWLPVTIDLVAPADAAYAVAWVWKNAGTDYGYLDDVVFAPAGGAPPPSSGNMIADGGFESGMSGWSNWGNAQVVAGAGTAGSKAMQVGTGAGGAGLTIPGIVPGTKYRLTAQVRVTDPADPASIGFNLRTASGGLVIGIGSPHVTSTGYTTVTVEFVAPEGSATAVVWAWKNAGSGYAYVDDIAFGPADAPPPPSTPPEGDLVTNGGFESGMTGWANWGNAGVVAGQASSGSSALAVGTAAGGAGQDIGGIVPGTIYRLLVQAKVSDPSETVLVGVRFTDDWGNLQSQSTGRTVSSTSYTAVALDTTAPPNATRATVYVWKNAGSGFAYVDDYAFGVAPGSPPPPPPAPPPSGNLVANGGFENGMANWVDWGNATATTGQAAAGSYAAQVGTGAGGMGQDVAGIVAGSVYRLSGSAKVGSAGETGYLGIKFIDSAGNALLERSVSFRSTAYGTAQIDLTAPANATKALVYVWKNAGNSFAYVDEVALVPALRRVPLAVTREQVNPQGSGRYYSSADIARLADGGSVIAWRAVPASDGVGASDVCFRRYEASGASAGPATCASRPGVGLRSVVARPGGGFTIVWNEANDSADASGRRWQDYDAAGTAQGPVQSGPLPIWLSAEPLAGGGYVNLVIAPDGSGTVWFQLYAADGTPIGSPQPVAPAAEIGGGVVVGLAGGGFAVAWMERDGSGALVGMTRAFSADGTPLGEPVALAPNTLGPVGCGKGGGACPPFQNVFGVVATADGGYIVGWMDGTGAGTGGGSFARRFRADGSPASLVAGRIGDGLIGSLAAAGQDAFAMAIVDTDSTGVSALHVDATPLR